MTLNNFYVNSLSTQLHKRIFQGVYLCQNCKSATKCMLSEPIHLLKELSVNFLSSLLFQWWLFVSQENKQLPKITALSIIIAKARPLEPRREGRMQPSNAKKHNGAAAADCLYTTIKVWSRHHSPPISPYRTSQFFPQMALEQRFGRFHGNPAGGARVKMFQTENHSSLEEDYLVNMDG